MFNTKHFEQRLLYMYISTYYFISHYLIKDTNKFVRRSNLFLAQCFFFNSFIEI